MKWICPICNLQRGDLVRLNESLKNVANGRCEPLTKLVKEFGLAAVDVARHRDFHLRVTPGERTPAHAVAIAGRTGAPVVGGPESALGRKADPSRRQSDLDILESTSPSWRPNRPRR